jgi:rare lipoprotein A
MRQPAFALRYGRVVGAGALALCCVALANCNQSDKLTSRVDPRYGVSASPRVVEPGQPVPKGGGTYRVGKPYVVGGQTYYPQENRRYKREGIASWYGEDFHGRLTANGEVYDMESVSAAHPTLPMPSYARVTNLRNGRSLIVRVNDRGPYHAGREIDLSGKAAELLEVRRPGTSRVRVEYVAAASLDGSDDRRLMATLREGMPAPAPSTVRVVAAKSFIPQAQTSPVTRSLPVPPERRIAREEAEPATVAAVPPPPRASTSSTRAEPMPPPRAAVAAARAPAEAVPVLRTSSDPVYGPRSQERLVWTTGPAPAVRPAAGYAAEPEAPVRVGRGGLY